MKKGLKIGLGVIAILFLIGLFTRNGNEAEVVASTTTNEQPISAPAEDGAKASVMEKLKAKAEKDWPNDYSTQEFWLNEQSESYDYMLTIEDNDIKKKAQRDWPLDFSTQKFWYNEQIEAKERLKQ